MSHSIYELTVVAGKLSLMESALSLMALAPTSLQGELHKTTMGVTANVRR